MKAFDFIRRESDLTPVKSQALPEKIEPLDADAGSSLERMRACC